MIMNMNMNLSSTSNDSPPPPSFLPFPSFQPPLMNNLNFNYNYNYNHNYNNHQYLMPMTNSSYTTNLLAKPDQDISVSSIGLNLGQRTYFSSDDASMINKLFSRSRGVYSSLSNQQQPPKCQAEGCHSDLSLAKHYHRRHKVCEFHSKATIVIAAGLQQRFCQQCSRFHVLSEFDETKRSCRKRLADHNRRRRKPQLHKNKQVMIMSTSNSYGNKGNMEREKKMEVERFEFEFSNLDQNQNQNQNQVHDFIVSDQHDEQQTSPNMSLLLHHNHNLFCSTSSGEQHEQQQQQQHNHEDVMFEVEFM